MRYSLEAIRPFLFDKIINIPPFPLKFEMPKYDKYYGNGYPHDKIRDFHALSMKVMHEKT